MGNLLRQWHSLMALVYMVVIVADLVVEPVLWSLMHHPVSPLAAVAAVSKLHDPTTELAALKIMSQTSEWSPITMGDGGILYATMTALVGGGAAVRAWQAKITASTDTPFGQTET